MINLDEEALECDFAESYHIYNYRELPLRKAALYAVGLRNNSRIKLKAADMSYPLDTILQAMATDRLSMLTWLKTKDGANGVNRPKLILSTLLGSIDNDDVMTFESADEYEETRKKIAEGRDGDRIG